MRSSILIYIFFQEFRYYKVSTSSKDQSSKTSYEKGSIHYLQLYQCHRIRQFITLDLEMHQNKELNLNYFVDFVDLSIHHSHRS